MPGLLANTQYIYSKQGTSLVAPRTKTVNSSQSIHFGNTRDYYRTLEPSLTEAQLDDYEATDNRWIQVIRNVEARTLTTITNDERPKTQAEFRALFAEVRKLPNVQIEVLNPNPAASGHGDASTYIHHGRAIIRLHANLNDSAKANYNFLILSHETLHALHSQKPSITPRQPSDTAALYEGICQVIDHVLRQGAQPLSQAEWNVQFNQRPFLYDNLKITKVDKLKKLRFLMISEIAAYTKSATLADSNAAKNNENSMSSGYKAALNWINAEINRQTLQTT